MNRACFECKYEQEGCRSWHDCRKPDGHNCHITGRCSFCINEACPKSKKSIKKDAR
nr:MAG TPA: hypothetical protein [Caudoviricetes sp.]